MLASIPFLPESLTGRMSTIKTYEEDSSASTRLAVWGWTLDFVKDNPFGGGFGAHRLNRVEIVTQARTGDENNVSTSTNVVEDKARAFHSAYFEVLGEHGYPGFALFMALLIVGLVQLGRLRRRYRDSETDQWISDLARALRHTLIIYMVGSLFIGVAFQSMLYFVLAFTAALVQLSARRERVKEPQPLAGPKLAAALR